MTHSPLLWSIDRRRGGRAPAQTQPGATLRQLADWIGLGAEPDQWRNWLTAPAEGLRRLDGSLAGPEQLHADEPLAGGQSVEVPNRVLMIWTGDLGWFGRWAVRWRRDHDYLRWRGFLAPETILDVTDETTGDRVLHDLAESSRKRELHGLFITGHGSPWDFGTCRGFCVYYSDVEKALTYRLALVAINACNGGWSRRDRVEGGRPEELDCGGRDLVSSSPGAKFWGVRRLMIPRILFLGMDTRHPSDLLRPGEQGTRG